MKERADAPRLVSIWVGLEITASSRENRVNHAKTKRESDRMHDYGGN